MVIVLTFTHFDVNDLRQRGLDVGNPVGIALTAVVSRRTFGSPLALQLQCEPGDVAAVGGDDFGLARWAGLAHGRPVGLQEHRVGSQQAM
ncbi:hypothetical protein D9M69_593540 [compost metagenome]